MPNLRHRDEWRKCKTGTISGVACIEHKYNQSLAGEKPVYEKCIAGKHGEIWQYNATTLACVVVGRYRKARLLRLTKSTKSPGRPDDEIILHFSPLLLAEVMEVLDVPKRLSLQVKYANVFAERTATLVEKFSEGIIHTDNDNSVTEA